MRMKVMQWQHFGNRKAVSQNRMFKYSKLLKLPTP